MAPQGAKMAQDRPKTGLTQPKMVQALKIVDRAAVDRAVDLARTLLSGAQGPGPRAGDPVAHTKPHIPCYLNLILLTSGWEEGAEGGIVGSLAPVRLSGPWAPDNNVRARSTARSTAARSTIFRA